MSAKLVQTALRTRMEPQPFSSFQTSGAVDVVVLGGGVAGLSAGICARLLGLSCFVLEAETVNRRRPGETLHPGVEGMFRQLGVWERVCSAGFHRHRGVWVQDLNGRRDFQAYGQDSKGPWYGFQIPRTRLIHILTERFQELGGTIATGVRCPTLLFEGMCITGVTGHENVFQCAFVIDATGPASHLVKALSLRSEMEGPKQWLTFHWEPVSPIELRDEPLFERRPRGWKWTAPLGDGSCAVAELCEGQERFGMDYTCRYIPQCAGAGYFLVGDAALLLDPSSGSGVLRAIMSATYATFLLGATLRGEATERQVVEEYRKWVERFFFATMAAMQAKAEREGAHASELIGEIHAPQGA